LKITDLKEVARTVEFETRYIPEGGKEVARRSGKVAMKLRVFS
jgi:hypothetical protein